MAAPHSLEENKFFASMAKEAGLSRLWVACNDRNTEKVWTCEGQERGSTFLNFAPGQLGIGVGEPCAELTRITSSHLWDDEPCSLSSKALCVLRSVPQTRDMCFTRGSYRQVPNACLIGHVIREFATRSNFKCAAACINHPGCRSFNVISTDQGKLKMCQLNNATLSDDLAEMVESNTHCSHYSV